MVRLPFDFWVGMVLKARLGRLSQRKCINQCPACFFEPFVFDSLISYLGLNPIRGLVNPIMLSLFPG